MFHRAVIHVTSKNFTATANQVKYFSHTGFDAVGWAAGGHPACKN